MIPALQTPEAFYATRDDRTRRCGVADRFADARVALSIDSSEAERFEGQFAFLLAANLLARWCRRVRFVVPAVALDPRLRGVLDVGWATHTSLGEAAAAVARAADPFGVFEVSGPAGGTWLRLHVGAGGPSDGFAIQGRGWLALGGEAVGTARPSTAPPLGAALAACIGVGWVFRAALGDRHLPRAVRLSLFDLEAGAECIDGPCLGPVDLGAVLLVGCGAVGSAIVFLLPILGLTGRFELVDRDLVDGPNLNRAPLFKVADVGRPKVSVCAEYLERHGITATPVEAWFDEAVVAGRVFRVRPDLVIPAANERDVRHLIQHHVPPLQVYGSTGRDWNAFLGRHIPLREDCLACRFPASPLSAPPMACGTGRADLATSARAHEPDAALPFLPTAAATLAVAELFKVAAGIARPGPNFACLDFRGAMDKFFAAQQGPRAGCVCDGQERVWHRINGATRFAAQSVTPGASPRPKDAAAMPLHDQSPSARVAP